MGDCAGTRSTSDGPGFVFYSCCTSLEERRSATVLQKGQYAVVLNDADASRRAAYGPSVDWLGPRERLAPPGVQNCPTLTREEYVKIKDEHGKLRVERGEARIVPDPLEEVIDRHINGGVKKAINIDEHHAVQFRNEDIGTVELITEHGLFIPGPYQEDVRVQEKIILESYERMVYKDMTGRFIYVSGDSED